MSVIPAERKKNINIIPKSVLIAANRTNIPTYGRATLKLNFKGLSVTHVFQVADIERPILGADFFAKNGLVIDLGG